MKDLLYSTILRLVSIISLAIQFKISSPDLYIKCTESIRWTPDLPTAPTTQTSLSFIQLQNHQKAQGCPSQVPRSN